MKDAATTPPRGQELLEAIRRQVRREWLMVPPLALHTPSPPLLAGMWALIREVMLLGRLPRAWKEALAVEISRLNACPFCVDAHSLFLQGFASPDLTRSVLAGRPEEVLEPQLRALLAWGAAHHDPGAEILRQPPFDPAEAPEALGVALGFHYLNRMVSAFLDSSPVPRGFRWMKGLVQRVGGPVAAYLAPDLAAAGGEAGASLTLVPRAPLPADLAWAGTSEAVAGAVAGFVTVVEEGGERSLPGEVRDLLEEHLAAWNGEAPELGRGWLEEAVARLPEAQRAAGRWAFLLARAPYQADSEVQRAYLSTVPGAAGEARLLEAAAWASLQAARRVGRWVVAASYLSEDSAGASPTTTLRPT